MSCAFFFSYFYHFYFVLFYFYFTGPERRSRSSSHQFNFLILLLQRARDVSRALFSSFFIILLSSRALVLFFDYPFYFPGPEMRSQRVLGPLFHHFLFLFLLHRARDASCVKALCSSDYHGSSNPGRVTGRVKNGSGLGSKILTLI